MSRRPTKAPKDPGMRQCSVCKRYSLMITMLKHSPRRYAHAYCMDKVKRHGG